MVEQPAENNSRQNNRHKKRISQKKLNKITLRFEYCMEGGRAQLYKHVRHKIKIELVMKFELVN